MLLIATLVLPLLARPTRVIMERGPQLPLWYVQLSYALTSPLLRELIQPLATAGQRVSYVRSVALGPM